MNKQDKAQAAGAVSIDSPEFRQLLLAYSFNGGDEDSDHRSPLIAHIDAHAAQRYEAGYRKAQEDSGLLMANLKLRKEKQAVEASMARLVEALQGITALYDTDEGCRSTPEYIAARSALALLPAKAEDASSFIAPNTLTYVKTLVQKEFATPAPAMGEELPDEREAFEAAAEKNGVYTCLFARYTPERVAHEAKNGNTYNVGDYHSTELQAGWKMWRACMALRQTGAEGCSLSDAEIRSIAERFDVSTDATKRWKFNDVVPFVRALEAHFIAAKPVDLNDDQHVAVKFYIDNPRATLFDFRQRITSNTTAPVSQPAAQDEKLSIAIETLRKVAASEWHMKSQLQQMCIDALSAIGTAPQPLSAPAGSFPEQVREQEKAQFHAWALKVECVNGAYDWSVAHEAWMARAALAAQQKNGQTK